jgi:hypothetical protein
MGRRQSQQHQEQLPDLCGPQAGRLPIWWSGTSQAELEAAHERARCLRAHGHGALPQGWLIGEGTFGEVFDRP